MLSFISFFVFLIPLSAFGYLDPGTGSFIIHVIVGGIVGVSYAIRVFWRNIKNATYYVIGRRAQEQHDEFNKGA